MSDRPLNASRVVGRSGAQVCADIGHDEAQGLCARCGRQVRSTRPRQYTPTSPWLDRETGASPVIDPPNPHDAIDVASYPGERLP